MRRAMAVLLASTSDLDDLIPTLVAYQVEWNKLHAAVRSAERPEGDEPDPAACAEAFGGAAEDWVRIREAWGDLTSFLDEMRTRRLNLRIRMLGGSQAGYARMTRRWWRPVRSAMEAQGLGDRPIYFASRANDINWCFGTESVVYNCSTAIVLGVATEA